MILTTRAKKAIHDAMAAEWAEEDFIATELAALEAVPIGTDITTLPHDPNNPNWPESWLEATVTFFGFEKRTDLWD